MFAQIKEALTTLIVSMFSKKFIAFVLVAWQLAQQRRWWELVSAFGAYAGVETYDKKKADAPQPIPSAEPIPPEATPEPTPEDAPEDDASTGE